MKLLTLVTGHNNTTDLMTKNYVLYATTLQASAANLQFWRSGRIIGCVWNVQLNASQDDGAYSAELSFQAVSQLATNNAQDIVSAVAGYVNFTTSGATLACINL